ncbi:hypothetical protein [Neodiprion abietis nucleopolyhedrovirus]|uniref:Uncharacterized protein n=1 Tax=Neodiprion abietis nucleopolyhedrovirus TaxID=204507 RepID=Q0ZP04_9CBAC|nr:hypothetical protein [Neodiprion abietis nucleopolyhedrovirus]ABC74950.1 unknown [Neodiprion abietis nucleopolyhedrovirus]
MNNNNNKPNVKKSMFRFSCTFWHIFTKYLYCMNICTHCSNICDCDTTDCDI